VTQNGWFGVWLLVASVALIVIEGVVIGIWSARLARRGRALAKLVEGEKTLIESDLERLRFALEETRMLWRPYGRILRWLRHPLVLALIGSYRRRWAAR